MITRAYRTGLRRVLGAAALLLFLVLAPGGADSQPRPDSASLALSLSAGGAATLSFRGPPSVDAEAAADALAATFGCDRRALAVRGTTELGEPIARVGGTCTAAASLVRLQRSASWDLQALQTVLRSGAVSRVFLSIEMPRLEVWRISPRMRARSAGDRRLGFVAYWLVGSEAQAPVVSLVYGFAPLCRAPVTLSLVLVSMLAGAIVLIGAARRAIASAGSPPACRW